MTEPLRLAWDVGCPADHAFRIWTEQFGAWWPPSHTVSGGPAEIVFEPRPGGRIYERAPDGTRHDWGAVTVWEPPRRLAYTWHIKRAASDATEVDVTFRDLGDGTSRVLIEQRGWERLGADGAAWRDRNRTAWAGLLPHFATACAPASNRP